MALRNQPYLPLYIQDFLTDERLINCSAQSTGVYIRLMCLMHKSDCYGKIMLRQKDKQTDKQIKNFALMFVRSLPYELLIIETALNELLEEKVIFIDGDYLCQKRMICDNVLSVKRAESGLKGGLKTKKKFASKLAKAKPKANNEYEDEIINYKYNSEKFKILWLDWKDYKKVEHRFSYKSKKTEQAALNELVKLSGDNENTAMDIIRQSIANSWKGFFQFKKINEIKKENHIPLKITTITGNV